MPGIPLLMLQVGRGKSLLGRLAFQQLMEALTVIECPHLHTRFSHTLLSSQSLRRRERDQNTAILRGIAPAMSKNPERLHKRVPSMQMLCGDCEKSVLAHRQPNKPRILIARPSARVRASLIMSRPDKSRLTIVGLSSVSSATAMERTRSIDSIGRNSDDTNNHRHSLAIMLDNSKRGRLSPLPQAVQGAQSRPSNTPSRDPGIKNEFSKMFRRHWQRCYRRRR